MGVCLGDGEVAHPPGNTRSIPGTSSAIHLTPAGVPGLFFCVAFPRFQENNDKSETYTGVYYLEGNIHIRNGATLEIDGTDDLDLPCKTLLLVRERESARARER